MTATRGALLPESRGSSTHCGVTAVARAAPEMASSPLGNHIGSAAARRAWDEGQERGGANRMPMTPRVPGWTDEQMASLRQQFATMVYNMLSRRYRDARLDAERLNVARIRLSHIARNRITWPRTDEEDKAMMDAARDAAIAHSEANGLAHALFHAVEQARWRYVFPDRQPEFFAGWDTPLCESPFWLEQYEPSGLFAGEAQPSGH